MVYTIPGRCICGTCIYMYTSQEVIYEVYTPPNQIDQSDSSLSPYALYKNNEIGIHMYNNIQHESIRYYFMKSCDIFNLR